MIDFNDGNDSNRYGSRRQSSLSSSSVCPYASDSLCDDDDDYNNEGEFIFQDEYDLDDEKLDSCDDDNFSNRHFNMNCLLQQQQLFLSQSTASSPISTNADNNTKRCVLILKIFMDKNITRYSFVIIFRLLHFSVETGMN